MNEFQQGPPEGRRIRRSTRVALVLLGTAGVIGGVTAWDALRKARQSDAAGLPGPEAPSQPLSADRTYTNNDFVPGAGYYHAPYHGWFPFPYNYHDPARGYFAGGLWQAAPFALGMLASRPTNPAVNAALIGRQQREAEERRRGQSSTLSGATSRGAVGIVPSSRPAPSPPVPPTAATPRSASSPANVRPASSPAPSSKPAVQRGGFGSSGRSGGSS